MARFVKTQFDMAAHTITWTIAGFAEPVVLHLDKVSESNKSYATYHGFNQRCADNAADEKTGAGKRKAIAEMVEFYEAGGDEWERARKGATGSRFDTGAVIAAMARVLFASDVDKANRQADATAAKRGISREDALKLFAADPRIAEDMDRARRAAMPVKVNADEFLADMVEGSGEGGEPTDEELDRLTQPETV